MRDILIVGGSLAGLRAAQELREQHFGGSINVLSAEHELPYDRPPLSKQYLTGETDRSGIALVTEQELAQAKISYHLDSRAVALDLDSRTVTTQTGQIHHFDGLIIATGLRPRTLDGTRCDDRIHVLRTIEDAQRLQAALVKGGRLAILGAGFLGAEVASSAIKLGVDVTVIERDFGPMVSIVGREISTQLAALHHVNGVRLHTGRSVAGVTRHGSQSVLVEMADGSSEEFDHVLLSLGAVPNTEWLDGSGLEIKDGVLCDSTLFAAPNITVAGDIARVRDTAGSTRRVEHWTHATALAEVAARNLLSGSDSAVPFEAVPYAWSDQFGARIEVLGSPRGDHTFTPIWRAETGSGALWASRAETEITALIGIDAFQPVLGVRRQLALGKNLIEAARASESLRNGLAANISASVSP